MPNWLKMVSWSPRVTPVYLSQGNPRKRSLFLIMSHQEHYTIYTIARTLSIIYLKTNYELCSIEDFILGTSKLFSISCTKTVILALSFTNSREHPSLTNLKQKFYIHTDTFMQMSLKRKDRIFY